MRILEDDVFADLEQSPAIRLAAIGGLDQVIYTGSFSKVLSASIRCGFIIAPADTINTLVDGNLRWNLGSQNLAVKLIHNILVSGAYRRHIETVRSKLAEAMAATSRSLATEGVRVWTEPVGGMYLWGELPQGLDAAEVARFGTTAKRAFCTRKCIQFVLAMALIHAL